MEKNIYLGLPPEKAYLEYTLRIWKKGNILGQKYKMSIEIKEEEIALFIQDFNNLEKIAKENPNLNKISEVNRSKEYFNSLKNLLENNKERNPESLKNKLEPLYEVFFGDKK